MVAIKTFINVRSSAALASGVVHAPVEISLTPANKYERDTARTADKVTMAIANNFIEPNLPSKIFILEGWRSNRFRKVP